MNDDPFEMFEQWCRENGFADVAEPPKDGRISEDEINAELRRFEEAIVAYNNAVPVDPKFEVDDEPF